jgi:hypothetical protein
MDTEAMIYIFGPALVLVVGLGIAFGFHSYAVFKGYVK